MKIPSCFAIVFLSASGSLHGQDAPESLIQEQALEMARSIGGKELGKKWFDHGDKTGPYIHAGRVVLNRFGSVSYAVAEPFGNLSETGLDVPDGAVEVHLDFFTSKVGQGWVTCHFFNPEIESTRPPKAEDRRSKKQVALGPAAEFAIEQGDLEFLKTLFDQGLEVNGILNAKSRTTPLYAAVWERKLEIAKFLLEKGADRSQRSRFAERPINRAVDWEMDDFCKLLAQPDADETLIAGVPEGALAEAFASYSPEQTYFIKWNGDDEPPAELITWLRKSFPNARPASRMETLERRPLGAHSWYRDTTDGSFGSLLELQMKPADDGWKATMRASVGPFLAGGGWNADLDKKFGYWILKHTGSWDE